MEEPLELNMNWWEGILFNYFFSYELLGVLQESLCEFCFLFYTVIKISRTVSLSLNLLSTFWSLSSIKAGVYTYEVFRCVLD